MTNSQSFRSRPRVSWSAKERIRILESAHEVQRDRPDLSGLPLLRAAMRCLPAERWRTIVSLTQVPWFEIGLASRSRTATKPDAAIPVLKMIASKLDAVVEELQGIKAVIAPEPEVPPPQDENKSVISRIRTGGIDLN